jgi:hypothetical protein
MNVDNSNNVSSLIASSISKLNLNTATRAFETSKKELENNNAEFEEISQETKQEDISLMNKKTPAKQIDVEDIQKYANYMGENLTIEDINYGLMYGRSVIADYSV